MIFGESGVFNGWLYYRFSVDQKGNEMTVTQRQYTDMKMDLKFVCCKGKHIR